MCNLLKAEIILFFAVNIYIYIYHCVSLITPIVQNVIKCALCMTSESIWMGCMQNLSVWCVISLSLGGDSEVQIVDELYWSYSSLHITCIMLFVTSSVVQNA